MLLPLAVVGGAALQRVVPAVAGAGALVGGGSERGGGYGICGEAPSGGLQQTTTAGVANVGSVGAGSSAGGGSVSPPSASSPSSHRKWRRHRGDSRTLHQIVPAVMVLRPIRQALAHSRIAVRLAERTCRAEALRRRRLHPFRQHCRRLAASPWRVPGSRPNRFSAASRLHRLARAMEALHLYLDHDQDQVRLRPRSCAAERAVTSSRAVPWQGPPLRPAHPIQAVLRLCPMLHPWATPVPPVRNRPQREGTRSLVPPIK